MQTNCLENSDECKTCDDSNDCNIRPSFTKCMDCRSTVDCAININVASSKTCMKYIDKCYTFIGRNGVERGCLSAQPKEFTKQCRNNPDKCDICKTKSGKTECNTKTFDDVEYCVDCDSSDEKCKMQSFLFRDKVCNGFNSAEKEGCYLRMVSLHS